MIIVALGPRLRGTLSRGLLICSVTLLLAPASFLWGSLWGTLLRSSPPRSSLLYRGAIFGRTLLSRGILVRGGLLGGLLRCGALRLRDRSYFIAIFLIVGSDSFGKRVDGLGRILRRRTLRRLLLARAAAFLFGALGCLLGLVLTGTGGL